MGQHSPWFSFAAPDHYPGHEPRFYERASVPSMRPLETHWRQIRDEVATLLASAAALRTSAYFDQRLAPKPGSWTTLPLYTQGLRYARNCARLPNTVAVLNSVPNLISASLSWLAPQSEIKPHFGDTDAYIRSHLGLVIPGRAPACGLEVAGEVRDWVEGELTLFCDAHQHRAWNHTDSPRLVLIADVIRPEFVSLAGWYNAQVLSALALYKLGAHAAASIPASWLNPGAGTGPAPLRRAAQLFGAVPFTAYAALQPRVGLLPPYG